MRHYRPTARINTHILVSKIANVYRVHRIQRQTNPNGISRSVTERIQRKHCVMYIYIVSHKTWQYTCDHNCRKSSWIFINLINWKTGMNALLVRYLLVYCLCDVNMASFYVSHYA